MPDETWRAGFDVAVGLDEAFRYRSHPSEDPSGAIGGVSH